MSEITDQILDHVDDRLLRIQLAAEQLANAHLLRDRFAMAALAGLAAIPNNRVALKQCAETAYAFADAMLAVRERK